MSNPKISVIIPVYNVEKYLSECLDSIVNQTFKDIEVICVNDCSTDNSLSILKEYASKDKRIKIISISSNRGCGYARKIALREASGEYILLCDSDDKYSYNEAFEDLYEKIKEVNTDLIIFDYFFITYKQEYRKYQVPEKEIFNYKDFVNFYFLQVAPWTKCYKKSFLDKYQDWYLPEENVVFGDNPLHFQVMIRAETISYLNKPLYTYFRRKGSLQAKKITEKTLQVICKHMQAINKLIKEECPIEKIRKDIIKFFFVKFFNRLESYIKNNGQFLKDFETSKLIKDTCLQIRQTVLNIDLSEYLKLDKEALFFYKIALRLLVDEFLEYLNKKFIKLKIIRLKRANDQVKVKNEQIKTKNELLRQRNEQLKLKNEQLQQKNEAIAKRDDLIKSKNEQLQQKNEQIKNRDSVINQKNSEIQNLHTQNNIQEQQIKRLQNSWSYRIGRLFTYPLSIPLELYKFIRDYNLIKKSNLFDSEYYLANNEDVKKAKVDPIKHYLQFGWKEGRNPSSEFDGNEYLNKRPDVRVAGICPLIHYLKFGKDEELSFIFEKIKNLESKNKILEKKLNEKSAEFEQLNRKKSEADVKFAESKKDFEKLNRRIVDLENFKRNILCTYREGINKEKVSFEIEKFFKSSKLGISTEKREPEFIVSLTSYPARIYDIHYCIYSLLIQSLKPNKIILWLGEEQFPNRDKDLPKKLLEFTKYGLTIKYTKDIKQFKKLLPSLKEYPNAIIVTADDDIFYPQNWLEKLYNEYENNKDCVVCHRAHKIKIENKKILPYNNWERCIVEKEPSFYNFFTGAGGVLYPPNSLYKDALNADVFTKINPKSDDVWFWSMAVLNGTKIKIVDDEPFRNLLYVNPEREIGLNEDGALWILFNKEEKNIQLEKLINYYPQIMEKLLSEKFRDITVLFDKHIYKK